MRSVHALACLLLLGASACQPSEEPEYTGWIGRTPEGPEVSLDNYEPPQELGVFRLQGEMDFPERQMRMFRYQNPDNAGNKMDVALYPLPPGWSDMDDQRAVAGHYGTVKHDMAERLARRNDSRVTVISEKVRSPEGLSDAVAEGVFRETTEDWTRKLVVQISIRDPVFVRVTADYPKAEGDNRLERIRAATRAFLERGEVAEPASGE
jgi:hypothetical protein